MGQGSKYEDNRFSANKEAAQKKALNQFAHEDQKDKKSYGCLKAVAYERFEAVKECHCKEQEERHKEKKKDKKNKKYKKDKKDKKNKDKKKYKKDKKCKCKKEKKGCKCGH